MGKGTGKGYKNMIGIDKRVHSMSAKGIKQPQKINPIMVNTLKKVKPKEETIIDKYNKNKDRDILPNRGMEQINILFKNANLSIGKMKDYLGKYIPIKLAIEVKETDLSTQAIYNGEGKLLYIGNTKKTTDLEKVSSYKYLSISGNIGNEQGGQIQDTLRKGLNDPDFDFKNKEAIKEILDIWDENHLNDLKAGTKKQEQALNRWKDRPKGESYSADVDYLKSKNLYNDRGYKYGSAWLVEDLPKNIITKLNNAIKRL